MFAFLGLKIFTGKALRLVCFVDRSVVFSCEVTRDHAIFASSLFVWFHCREQKHFLYVVCVSQEHSQAINAHSPSSSGRETVFESLYEALVDTLRLIIASVLSRSLILEALKLDGWVIKLCVSVDDLVLVGEELEALCKALLSSMPFS